MNEVCLDADNFCFNEVEYLFDIYAGRDEYDIRYLTPDPFPYTWYVDYLNDPKVMSAIGAYQNYSESSNTVYTAFSSTGDDAREDGTVEAIRSLLNQGVRVMLYFGDADFICNWVGGEAVTNKIAPPGFSKAGFANISTSDGVWHGQVKESGLFSFVRIFEAGHEVPFYQPLAALEVFDRAINGKDIQTGKKTITSKYLTSGPARSTYHQGNATIQFEVTPSGSTYNTTTNEPNPPPAIKRSPVPKNRKLPYKPNMGRYRYKHPRLSKKMAEAGFHG